ncbi:MAG: hypothetical protein V2A74_05135, partial [bacterium]
GVYTVEVIDEESKIDLNFQRRESVALMMQLIEQFGYRDKEAEPIANAIWDWKDADDNPLGPIGEKENEYYTEEVEKLLKLKKGELPLFRMKNDRFTTVEELLDVPGMTPTLFYGYDPDDPKEYNKSVNSWWSDKPEERVLGLRDLLTLNSSGKLNLNTASKPVLIALMAAAKGSPGEAEALAEKIMDARQGARSARNIDNDNAFRNLADISRVSDIAPWTARMTFYHPFDIQSATFTIRSRGTVGEVSKTIEVVVRRNYEIFVRDEKSEDRSRHIIEQVRKPTSRDRKNLQIPNAAVRILSWKEY